MRSRRHALVTVTVAVLLLSGCDYLSLASVDSSGGPSNGDNTFPQVSADGRYVAFTSLATDVAGGTNAGSDVFVRDLRTGVTSLVSATQSGGPANGDSSGGFPSGDARFVAFTSSASDLVSSDGNGVSDAFVRDRQSGVTTRVSVNTSGGDANGNSAAAGVSDDGRYIVFESAANDLVPNDGGGPFELFVRDRQTNTTDRISIASDGGDPDGNSGPATMTPDGRFVAFVSEANNLVPGDSNGLADVFVRDRQAGTTTRISVDSAGGDDNGPSSGVPSISANGRYVAFTSRASDLVSGDNNGTDDVFVRDRQAATTTRVSVDMSGGDANLSVGDPSISGDGGLVAFTSGASDLVPGDTNNATDVFVRNLTTGATSRVSVNLIGIQANGSSFSPSLSADGRYVAFSSGATNLVGGDTNNHLDVFVREIPSVTVASVNPSQLARGMTATLDVTGSGFLTGVMASLYAGGASGVTVDSVDLISPTELHISITAASNANTGPRNLSIWNPGTGPGAGSTSLGICNGCLTITRAGMPGSRKSCGDPRGG